MYISSWLNLSYFGYAVFLFLFLFLFFFFTKTSFLKNHIKHPPLPLSTQTTLFTHSQCSYALIVGCYSIRGIKANLQVLFCLPRHHHLICRILIGRAVVSEYTLQCSIAEWPTLGLCSTHLSFVCCRLVALLKLNFVCIHIHDDISQSSVKIRC